jgi:hypothetical protein
LKKEQLPAHQLAFGVSSSQAERNAKQFRPENCRSFSKRWKLRAWFRHERAEIGRTANCAGFRGADALPFRPMTRG